MGVTSSLPHCQVNTITITITIMMYKLLFIASAFCVINAFKLENSGEAASRSKRSTLTNIASHLTAELVGELVGEHVDEIVKRVMGGILGVSDEELESDPFVFDAIVDGSVDSLFLGRNVNPDESIIERR